MKKTKSFIFALAALATFVATAQAQPQYYNQQQGGGRCNPPPGYLQYDAWYRECEQVLQARFRDSNPYGLPYSEFVRMVWQMYEVIYFPGRHPTLMGQPCSPEGSGYMNPSGHAQICRGGRWQVYGN